MVAAPDGVLMPDVLARAPGRGLYVCPTPACIAALPKSGRLKKSSAGKVSVDAVWLLGAAIEGLRARVASLLALARRSGNLAIGAEAACEAQRAGTAVVTVVASDAGVSSDGLLGTRFAVLDKKGLGSLIGSGDCAALALLDAGLASTVAAELDRLERLSGGGGGASKGA
jgi:hypothetical protein